MTKLPNESTIENATRSSLFVVDAVMILGGLATLVVVGFGLINIASMINGGIGQKPGGTERLAEALLSVFGMILIAAVGAAICVGINEIHRGRKLLEEMLKTMKQTR